MRPINTNNNKRFRWFLTQFYINRFHSFNFMEIFGCACSGANCFYVQTSFFKLMLPFFHHSERNYYLIQLTILRVGMRLKCTGNSLCVLKSVNKQLANFRYFGLKTIDRFDWQHMQLIEFIHLQKRMKKIWIRLKWMISINLIHTLTIQFPPRPYSCWPCGC